MADIYYIYYALKILQSGLTSKCMKNEIQVNALLCLYFVNQWSDFDYIYVLSSFAYPQLWIEVMKLKQDVTWFLWLAATFQQLDQW